MKEKDIKFEDVPMFTRYMNKKMTGLEAYRCMQNVIGDWAERTQNEYAIWLSQNMHGDMGLWYDFEKAIKEMLEEREEGGNKYLAFKNPDFSYKPCKHCQED